MHLPELNLGYHSEVLETIWNISIKPILRSWVSEVMTSPEMSESERKGKIIAYNEILKGFLKMYENSKLDPPDWLFKEFYV